MGHCQVIAGSQCGFLLADGASVLDSLSEVQGPIDVKWAFCLPVPLVRANGRLVSGGRREDFAVRWTWADVLTAGFFFLGFLVIPT